MMLDALLWSLTSCSVGLQGLMTSFPEHRDFLRNRKGPVDGLHNKDWMEYMDKASKELEDYNQLQNCDADRLILSAFFLVDKEDETTGSVSHRLKQGMTVPYPPVCLCCRHVFGGNEAILIRDPIASVHRNAQRQWNNTFFAEGELESANVDAVLHMHRPEAFGNVRCMVCFVARRCFPSCRSSIYSLFLAPMAVQFPFVCSSPPKPNVILGVARIPVISWCPGVPLMVFLIRLRSSRYVGGHSRLSWPALKSTRETSC